METELAGLIRENKVFADQCFEGTEYIVPEIDQTSLQSALCAFEPVLSKSLPAYLNPQTLPRVQSAALASETLALRSGAAAGNFRLYRVIQSHNGWVRTVAVSSDNKFFATGSQDTTTKLFDLATGKLQVTLTGHVEGVRCVAFSSSQPLLYSGGEDDVVKIFDLSAGGNRLVHQIKAHKAGVFALAESASALSLLASAGRDRVVRLHDLRSKKPVHGGFTGHTAAVECLSFSAKKPNLLFSGSTDSTIRVWDVVAGRCLHTLTNHKRAVKFVGERSDGALLSVGTDAVRVFRVFGGEDGFVHEAVLHRPPVAVHAAALAPLGDVLAVVGDRGSLDVIDAKSGRPLQNPIHVPAIPGSLSGEDALYAACFDRSESRLLTGGADKAVKMFKSPSS